MQLYENLAWFDKTTSNIEMASFLGHRIDIGTGCVAQWLEFPTLKRFSLRSVGLDLIVFSTHSKGLKQSHSQ